MKQVEKIAAYRDVCKHLLQNGGWYIHHLYYEQLPAHLLGADYEVAIAVKHIDWKNDGSFGSGVFSHGHKYAGSMYETYNESCKA